MPLNVFLLGFSLMIVRAGGILLLVPKDRPPATILIIILISVKYATNISSSFSETVRLHKGQ